MAENKSDYLDLEIEEQVKKLQSMPKVDEMMTKLLPATGEISVDVLVRTIMETYGEGDVESFLDALDRLASLEVVTITDAGEGTYNVALTSKGALFLSKMA